MNSKKTEQEDNNLSVESGDTLELTLGFGSASSSRVKMHRTSAVSASESSSSSSFPSQPIKQMQQLSLRLKLGFEGGNHSTVEPSKDQQGLWSTGHLLPFPSSQSSSSLYSTMLHASVSSPSANFTPVQGLSWSVPTVGNHCSERPHPGLWFSLRSIINRDGEVLPQVPKSYIRVKNENVTVFMVKTYIVRKLGLSNEAQVEISCMGQNLLHSQRMKDVRDQIWLPKFLDFLNSNPLLRQNSHTAVHYLLSLDYRKCCSFN